MSVSPTSLANLRPAWRSGETGNAGGRPRGYEPIPSKLRRMQDWPLEKLRATYADESASVAVRVCARMLLMAMEGDDSTAQQAFVEVADRTADKAIQSVQMTQETSTDAGQLLAVLRERYPRRQLERRIGRDLEAERKTEAAAGSNLE